MQQIVVFFLLIFSSQQALSQGIYEKAPRNYNVEIKLSEDDSIKLDYAIEFLKTDTTDYAIYETSSLDTFLFLMHNDLSLLPESKNDLLVYIHGFMGGQTTNLRYTKFDLQDRYIDPSVSQLGRLLSIKWPGNKPVYKVSKGNISKVAATFADMLVHIITSYQDNDNIDTEVSIMNHSLGNEMFKEMVQYFPSDIQLFDQVILAAPDLDTDVFVAEGALANLSDHCNRATVYLSNKDLTLGFSRELNKKGRLGLDGPDEATLFSDKLYFIDMSHVLDEKFIPMKMTGHSYYRGSDAGSYDMLQTLRGSQPDTVTNRKVHPDIENAYKVILSEEN